MSGPPANSAVPTISGTTNVGDTLTAGNGTWSGYPAPAFTYQWKRCDSDGNNCANVASATAGTYMIVSADQGNTLRDVVTARNGSGSSAATSNATAQVTGSPVNTALPTLSGPTPALGTALTVADGTWTGFQAPGFTRQWERCDQSGANCVDIGGATGTSYTLVPTDVGTTIRGRVTGTNTAGSSSADSAQ